MSTILAIDPGASGGIALSDGTTTETWAMPDGMTAQVDLLRELVAKAPGALAWMERVGLWMPGDHPNSACKFARHCGQLEAALYALGVPVRQVLPRTWMPAVCGTLPKDKPARKRAIKEEMARRYPLLSVTLSTADALGILEYALKTRDTNHQNVGR